jgi:filamentous hemagglutinin
MSYLGLDPQSQLLNTSTQFFNGDGSTIEFFLDRSVASASDLDIIVGSVAQKPFVDYNAQNLQLLFTTAPGAGANNVVVTYRAGALNSLNLSTSVFQAGTVGLPSVYSVAANNTGLYWANAVTFAVTVAGANRAIFSNNIQTVSNSTGALTVQGGIGLTGNVFQSGRLTVANTTNSANIGSGAIVTTGGVGIAGNLNVGGDLVCIGDFTVNGNFTTTATDSLAVADPFIFLANTNAGDSFDMGVIASYNDGTQRYTGYFRDVTDGKYKLFTNLTVQPTTVVDTADPSFKYTDLILSNVTATGNVEATFFVGNGSQLTGISTASSGILNGNSTVIIPSNNGNILANVNAVTIGLFSAGGLAVAGNLTSTGTASATGNITGGNIITGGLISATGNIASSANVSGGNIITGGGAFVTGNVEGGNIATSGNTLTGNLSATGTILASSVGATTLSSTRTSSFGGTIYTVTIQGTQSTGDVRIGGTAGTGPIVLGQSTASQTLFIGNGATSSGNTKTISFGENGAAGSTTNINIGPVAAAGIGTATFATGTTVTVANTGGSALSVAGNITGGNISATGNVSGGNVTTPGVVSATGNVNGFELNLANLRINTRTVASEPYAQVQSLNATNLNLVAAATRGASLSSEDFAQLYYTSNIANVDPINGNDQAIWLGVDTNGVYYSSNAFPAGPTWTAATNQFNFTGNVTGNLQATFVGNVQGGNLVSLGLMSATANVTGGNITTPGLITATGTIQSTANITGGNIITAGLITATGAIQSTANVTGGNISTAGLITATGNITGGNVITGGLITATGVIQSTANVSGGNLITTNLVQGATVSATTNVIAANVQTGTLSLSGNVLTDLNSTSGITTTANITGGNIIASAAFSTTGNVTGGNLITGGLITATGTIQSTANITAGNLITGGLITATGTIQATANITGGNIITGGLITATGAIQSTANVTGGNIITGGLVSATGNVTGGNLLVTGNIVETSGELGILTSSNGNIRLIPNGTGQTIVSGLLSVTGNVTAANVDVATGTVRLGNIINANGNAVGNIGAAGAGFNTIFARATSALYADLAETYLADADYAPGTVVVFGGDKEVTMSRQSSDPRVAGVISTNPAHVMNSGLEGDHTAVVALVGRVPTNVVGPVHKGDLMVSCANGYAQASAAPMMGTVIGKALEDFLDERGTIEIVVGRL